VNERRDGRDRCSFEVMNGNLERVLVLMKKMCAPIRAAEKRARVYVKPSERRRRKSLQARKRERRHARNVREREERERD
jgi:ribosomal protein S21